MIPACRCCGAMGVPLGAVARFGTFCEPCQKAGCPRVRETCASPRPIPPNLIDAYAWTEGNGDIPALSSLDGSDAREYAKASAESAQEKGERVTMTDLLDLCAWLKGASPR